MGSASSSDAKAAKAREEWEKKFAAFQQKADSMTLPLPYSPPQFHPDCLRQSCGLCKINAIDHRAPLCAAPTPPCCCAQATVSMFAPRCNIETFRMSDPDEAFKKYLAYCHPNCPDFFKGVFVMQDNIDTNMIVTLQDADWSSKSSGVKKGHYNWSSDYGTCYGALGAITAGGLLTIEVSEDQKWVSFLQPGYKEPQWAYVMQEGDVLKTPDGKVVACEPGEMVRMNFWDAYNPSSGIYYQYRLRRVAYYDEEGNLKKTPAYDEYVKRATAPMPHQGCCCNYCLCNLTYSEIAENFEYVSDELAVVYYPAAKDESSEASTREPSKSSSAGSS